MRSNPLLSQDALIDAGLEPLDVALTPLKYAPYFASFIARDRPIVGIERSEPPHLRAIVQELVSRSDWSSGNAISLIFSRAAEDKTTNTTIAQGSPTLILRYDAPPGSGGDDVSNVALGRATTQSSIDYALRCSVLLSIAGPRARGLSGRYRNRRYPTERPRAPTLVSRKT